MNKKFTMVCASLLLTSAFTVNAQTLNFGQAFDPSTEVIKLPEGNAGNLYHLQATAIVEANGETDYKSTNSVHFHYYHARILVKMELKMD